MLSSEINTPDPFAMLGLPPRFDLETQAEQCRIEVDIGGTEGIR